MTAVPTLKQICMYMLKSRYKRWKPAEGNRCVNIGPDKKSAV